MSRFVNGAVERMPLGGEDWVDLRLQLGYGAKQSVAAKTLGALAARMADHEEGDPMPAGSLDLEAGNVELLRRAIVAWGGPGFCRLADHDAGGHHYGPCEPVPITLENIAQLDETGDRILQWLEPRLKKPTPDFTKPSSPPAATAETAGPTSSG